MAASFNGSSNYLLNSAPALASTGYPLTFGCWFKPASVAAFQHFMMHVNFTTPGHRLTLRINTSAGLDFIANNAGAGFLATIAGPLIANAWHYVVARAISVTSRRVAVLFPDGSIQHAQNTTSCNPTGLNRFAMGSEYKATPAFFYSGLLEEVFYADADVQADGAQLDERLLRQLAFAGPFSIASLQQSIVEYHAMRSSLPTVQREPAEHAVRGSLLSTGVWTENGGVSLAPRCPLPASYQAPRGVAGMAMI